MAVIAKAAPFAAVCYRWLLSTSSVGHQHTIQKVAACRSGLFIANASPIQMLADQDVEEVNHLHHTTSTSNTCAMGTHLDLGSIFEHHTTPKNARHTPPTLPLRHAGGSHQLHRLLPSTYCIFDHKRHESPLGTPGDNRCLRLEHRLDGIVGPCMLAVAGTSNIIIVDTITTVQTLAADTSTLEQRGASTTIFPYY